MENKDFIYYKSHTSGQYYQGNKPLYVNDFSSSRGYIVVTTSPDVKFWNRFDGPCYFTMGGVESWWINDCDVTPLIKDWAKENDIDLNNLSNENINLIKLIWSDFSY